MIVTASRALGTGGIGTCTPPRSESKFYSHFQVSGSKNPFNRELTERTGLIALTQSSFLGSFLFVQIKGGDLSFLQFSRTDSTDGNGFDYIYYHKEFPPRNREDQGDDESIFADPLLWVLSLRFNPVHSQCNG